MGGPILVTGGSGQLASALGQAAGARDVRVVGRPDWDFDRVATLPNTWFDCSAHRIHCDCVMRGYPNVAPPKRRFEADYTDPSAVLLALAEAYPTKLIWGSDTPFQSYVDHTMSLRSTYAEETACLKALPPDLHRAVTQDNVLTYLQLSDENPLALG